MKKIKVTGILEYDDEIMHGTDEESKHWFYNEVLTEKLILHSNFIGDEVGEFMILDAEEII